MKDTTYRTPKTLQYRCLNCGFQSGSQIFKPITKEENQDPILCPDCDSPDIIDADTMEMVNPRQAK